MSFLSQRFDNLSTNDKENRLKVSTGKVLQTHDENTSHVVSKPSEVIG